MPYVEELAKKMDEDPCLFLRRKVCLFGGFFSYGYIVDVPTNLIKSVQNAYTKNCNVYWQLFYCAQKCILNFRDVLC